ncbi:hypothetical protein BDV95DRAFT_662478 [Massariosphaeria phaeospora]|uniref:Uncharacterized protein n=1 Tax=Massariosphaeria phaeospora TaxID=100035 RepID=A0A7C8M9J2_9PLEO|nr:hypothetical protein BDV95DRAFT_662478 [Massariosphaeria phaeospora]
MLFLPFFPHHSPPSPSAPSPAPLSSSPSSSSPLISISPSPSLSSSPSSTSSSLISSSWIEIDSPEWTDEQLLDDARPGRRNAKQREGVAQAQAQCGVSEECCFYVGEVDGVEGEGDREMGRGR